MLCSKHKSLAASSVPMGSQPIHKWPKRGKSCSWCQLSQVSTPYLDVSSVFRRSQPNPREELGESPS